VIYYLGSLFTLKRTFLAWKMRRRNIRPVDGAVATVR